MERDNTWAAKINIWEFFFRQIFWPDLGNISMPELVRFWTSVWTWMAVLEQALHIVKKKIYMNDCKNNNKYTNNWLSARSLA